MNTGAERKSDCIRPTTPKHLVLWLWRALLKSERPIYFDAQGQNPTKATYMTFVIASSQK